MKRVETGLLYFLCLAMIFVSFCYPIDHQNRYGQDCKLDVVDDTCGFNGRCKQENDKTGAKCTCQQGYMYINRECKMVQRKATTLITVTSDSIPNETEEGNSIAVIFLVPTCLIIIAALSYFGAQRYKWVQRFRQFHQNRYGSVLVTRGDSDDDDPPIA
ncbi:PREDICTED: uncharacterized protein LOC105366661 [Ceratosolen solmsi marchali]|uniref:Uncharacterized protein LOC105366661 n=1 Tax=Ceratosolen solmsi marchali TaxID=326594 RepID=A0AAJ6YSQ5_9HYME|nr:PREDICTED: uncharacterized protein LOC105366661 [Ceratosolen solmsi marchali]